MKPRYLALGVALIAFSLLFVVILQDDRILIQWKLEEGQVIRIRETQRHNDAGGQILNTTKIHSITVKSIDRDGTYVCDVNSEVVSAEGFTAEYLKSINAPSRTSKQFRLQPNGEGLSDLSGPSSLIADFILPTYSVSVGDSWIREHEHTVADMTLKESQTYRLVKVENSRARIEMETSLISESRTEVEDDDYRTVSFTRTRVGVFSLSEGMLVEWSEETRNVTKVLGEEKTTSSELRWTIID